MLNQRQFTTKFKRYMNFIKFHFKYTLKFPYFEGLLIFSMIVFIITNQSNRYIGVGTINIYEFPKRAAELIISSNITIFTFPILIGSSLLITLGLGNSFNDGTLRMMLTLPINRIANLFTPVFLVLILFSSLNSIIFLAISTYYYSPFFNAEHILLMTISIWIITLLYSSLSAFFGALFKNNIATLGFPIILLLFYNSLSSRMSVVFQNLFTPNALFYHVYIGDKVTFTDIITIFQYDLFISLILLFLAVILFRRDIK